MMATRRSDAPIGNMVDRVRAAFGCRRSATPGQALVWFAITATVLFGCVALVTDTGQIWMSRRRLQNAADAATLAGVQQLPNDSGGARSIACDYGATKNVVPLMTLNCNDDIEILSRHA